MQAPVAEHLCVSFGLTIDKLYGIKYSGYTLQENPFFIILCRHMPFICIYLFRIHMKKISSCKEQKVGVLNRY